LQYSREISLGIDSPRISFHAVMKNASPRVIRWSMQSVTQYRTDDSTGQAASANVWAFTSANDQSCYTGGYFVRSGHAPPGLALKNGFVMLNYSSVESELWFDTQDGWLAVADLATQNAMVERFHLVRGEEYPGNATAIFYTNDGGDPDEHGLYYMEAEINSPMVRLLPGETYAMETEWYPTRASNAYASVITAGV